MVLAAHPKQKLSASDKKRHGLHHKPSKHYTKTYWPYLPMLMIVAFGLILNATWHVGKSVLGYATDVSVTTLLQDTNLQRSQNGLNALSLNSQLDQAAQAKANDMVARNYWSHVTPSGAQPWQFITTAGYNYADAGENLAYGFASSDATLSAWMNSPEHRANILNGNYQDVGFGIANATNFQGSGPTTVIVAEYAKPQLIVTPSSAKTGRAPVAASANPGVVGQPNTQTLPPSRPGSRIDVLTAGNAQWAGLLLSLLASVSLVAFAIRHGRIWRRYWVKGEAFIIHHPLFDTVIIAISTLGFVLSSTSGFIH